MSACYFEAGSIPLHNTPLEHLAHQSTVMARTRANIKTEQKVTGLAFLTGL